MRGTPSSLDEFFEGYPRSRKIFDRLQQVIADLGPSEIRVTRSQVAFRRRAAFAWAWVPAKYLHGEVAPLVLTHGRSHRDPSPRWKEIVKIAPGRLTHHLELWSSREVDAQVRGWLQEAWQAAG